MNQNVNPYQELPEVNSNNNQPGVATPVNIVSIPAPEDTVIPKKKIPFKPLLIGFIIGCLFILSIMFYLFISGKVLFSNDVLEKSEQEIIELEKKYESSNKFVPFKLDKCINSTLDDNHYYRLATFPENINTNVVDNEIIFNLTREQESKLANNLDDSEPVYKITGFDKKIAEIYIGGFGNTIELLSLFVITKDGSLYYSNLYEGLKNSKDKEFNNLELVKDTKGITKLLNAKSYNGEEVTFTMLGVLKDGSYYDMNEIINRG